MVDHRQASNVLGAVARLDARVQEREDRIAKETAALDEKKAKYISQRKTDTVDLVCREEAAAAFEAERSRVTIWPTSTMTQLMRLLPVSSMSRVQPHIVLNKAFTAQGRTTRTVTVSCMVRLGRPMVQWCCGC